MSFSCLNDDTLGPVVHGCRDDFDFTVKFQQVVLSIVPSSIFIAAAFLRLAHLFRQQKVVDAVVLQWLKLVSTTETLIVPTHTCSDAQNSLW